MVGRVDVAASLVPLNAQLNLSPRMILLVAVVIAHVVEVATELVAIVAVDGACVVAAQRRREVHQHSPSEGRFFTRRGAHGLIIGLILFRRRTQLVAWDPLTVHFHLSRGIMRVKRHIEETLIWLQKHN